MIEELVQKCGEEYRLLVDVMSWLDVNEPKWRLKEPIDRELLIGELMKGKPKWTGK